MAFNQVNALEFNQIKAQIKEYLRSQSQFSDYDFEGSSLTVLIDTLAYNTYYTSVNANLAVNEGFLETAVLRENVVKLARMIGYTPKSARSARTTVNISVQTTFPYPKSVTMAAGLAAITSDTTQPFGLMAYLGLALWIFGFSIEGGGEIIF